MSSRSSSLGSFIGLNSSLDKNLSSI
jgi:hypothetical protein